MNLTEITYDSARPIDSYGPGFFRVAGKVFHSPVLVTSWSAAPWAGLEDTDAVLALRGQIDVLFLGTGTEIDHAPPGFRSLMEAAGIGVEVMNSPAAARTYNVLLSEGRRIAAALLPVT